MSVNRNILDHNAPFEPVHKWSVQAYRFLAQSDANLLVNGGYTDTRIDLLLQELNLQDGVSVVLTSSPLIEHALVEAASYGCLNRRLILCSCRYPNYDPLCGIGAAAGSHFLANVAEMLGMRERGGLIGYFNAFLDLYRRVQRGPISLRALQAFAGTSEAELLQLAAQTDEQIYLRLIENTGGATQLRNILYLLTTEFDTFTAKDGSGLSLLTASEATTPTIICIRPDGDASMAAKLLTAELAAAMDKPFHLLAADCRLLTDEGFAKVFEARKQEQHGTTALFTENIVGLADAEQLQTNFPRKIILLEGKTDPRDLQFSLSALGSYQHFAMTDTVNTPMKLLPALSFQRSINTGITQYERARILYEEVRGNEAVLYSPNSGLIVAANLKTT